MKFVNLLPSNLKGTKWEDFFQSLDSYIREFKNEKIISLKNKFIPSESTEFNLKDLVIQKGYKIIELEGYTSTIEFLKRRAENIPFEIAYLLSEKCYQYVLKSFWFYGNVYGLKKDPDTYYYKTSPYLSVSTSTNGVRLLDQEEDIIYYYIGEMPVPNPPSPTNLPALFLDTDEFPNLDMEDLRDGSNHFLIEYSFNKADSYNYFQKSETSRSLYDTVAQIHRIKEIPHYQVYLPLEINSNGSVNEKTYQTYSGEESAIVKSIYIQGNFNLAVSVEIGNSYHPVLDNSITGCKIPIGSISISEMFTVIDQTPSGINIEYKISEYGKFTIPSGSVIYEFSEIAFKDVNSNVIAYVNIPSIEFYEKKYTSVRLDVSCVDVS